MSRPATTLAKILSAIVKSLFFSGIMFIIFFSIITGGFPPDFRKLSKAFGNTQELAKMSNPQNITIHDKTLSHFEEENEISHLEAFNKKRAKLGEGLFGADSSTDEEEHIPSLRTLSSVPQEDLKAQLQDLQQEIFRLQQRVSELEEQAKTKH